MTTRKRSWPFKEELCAFLSEDSLDESQRRRYPRAAPHTHTRKVAMLRGLLFEVSLSQSQRSTQERPHDLGLKAWGARGLAQVQEKASMTIELVGKDC